MKEFIRGEPFSHLFKAGTVVWRSVGFSGGSLSPRLDDTVLEKTDRGSWIGRIYLEHGFSNEPGLCPNRVEGVTVFGLVVFVDSELPKDWTHLLVTDVSKAASSEWDPTEKITRLKGMAVHATVAKPYDMEAYLRFRQSMAQDVISNLNADAGLAQSIALRHFISDKRSNERRLVTKFRWQDPRVLLDYCHIVCD